MTAAGARVGAGDTAGQRPGPGKASGTRRRRPGRPRGRRHRSREAALQILYACEVGQAPPDAVAEVYWREQAERPALGPADRAFAEALVRGTLDHLGEIDARLAGVLEHWRPGRLALVDRTILRLAAYELLFGDTPPAVAIDEAIELARTFSTEESAAFVNGVLDAVRRGVATPEV